MGSTARNRLLIVWAALTLITLVSWGIGASHGTGPIRPDAAVALGAIAITLIKVRVIIREFMDVRAAPKKLKTVTDAWLITFGLAMLAAYFF
jgi:Prokaryotic Cytochrome C oxidase subunit IV